MHVRFLKPEEAEDLRAFVEKQGGGIEQIWDWGLLQVTIPGRDAFYVIGAFKGEELVGSMLVIRQNMGGGKTWLWCPGGPILKDEAAWPLMRAKCEEVARAEGDVFMRVESRGDVELGGCVTGERYLPQHTLMIDLSVSEEGILKQMTQKGRYNIRKAEKGGVFVMNSDFEDFSDFYEMLEVTAKRDGFHVHGREFYSRLLDFFPEEAFLYMAHKGKEKIAGMLVIHFGDTATYYFGASGNESRRSMAPYALQWFAMKRAKKAGMKRYDFLGVAPEGDSKHSLAGVTQFKTRFGGERVNYGAAQVFVYRRGWWWLRNLGKALRRIFT